MSVEFCILIGVLLSFFIYVPRAARVELTELILSDDGVIRVRGKIDPNCSRMKLYNFEGELFFGSSPEFESHLEKIESVVNAETLVVIFRVKHVRNPDAVCLELLDLFIKRLKAKGIEVALSGVRDDLYPSLVKTGIVQELDRKSVV